MFFGFTNDLEKEIEEKDHLIRKLNADMKRMRALSREEKKALQKELNSSKARLQNLDTHASIKKARKEGSSNKNIIPETNNTRYFYDAAEIIISLARRDKKTLSIAAVSIDDFESIRTKHSKEVVNKIIQAIVHKLSTIIRESDVFVKFDDAKFMLLFPQTSLAQAKIVSEKLRKAISLCKVVVGEDFSVSIGVTEYSLSDDNMNIVLQRVNKLVEEAKKTKNTILS